MLKRTNTLQQVWTITAQNSFSPSSKVLLQKRKIMLKETISSYYDPLNILAALPYVHVEKRKESIETGLLLKPLQVKKCVFAGGETLSAPA